jgi:hypothetical protein
MYIGTKYTFSILDVENCTYLLSRDGGNTYPETLATNVAAVITNPGEDNEQILNSFEWTVTGPIATDCKVKYVDLSDDTEYIGNSFSITALSFTSYFNSPQSGSPYIFTNGPYLLMTQRT